MNTWNGEKLRISVFGESHGKAVGCVIDGLPNGIHLDYDFIKHELDLRKPASSAFDTKRCETDEYEIISGVTRDITNGSPLCVIFKNKDAKSSDYNTFVPRPAHADFAAYVKYNGNCDLNGGGHFSARLTAPLVFAGAICRCELNKRNILSASAISSIGKTTAKSFYDVEINSELISNLDKRFPLIDDNCYEALNKELEFAKSNNDSVGGTVECCLINLPIGLGEPFFNSVESTIAKIIFSIPAVKGIEFGKGFELSKMYGSEANDEYNAKNIKKFFENPYNSAEIAYTNNAGGINGGLTNSMPVVFKVAFKPIPSIAQNQKSVDMLSYEPVIVKTEGRHDVCAALRGAVVVRAAACICIYDYLIGGA